MVFWPWNIKNTPTYEWESRQEEPNTINDTPNTEKQEQTNENELSSNNDWNNTHPNHTEQTLTQEEEMIIENSKRIMSEKKTRLPPARHKDWKTVKAESKK